MSLLEEPPVHPGWVRESLPREEQKLGDPVKEAVAEALAETPHQCPECSRRFATASGLGRHRATTHGVPGQSRDAEKRRKRQESAPKKGAPKAKSTPKKKVEPVNVDDIFGAVAEMLFPTSVPTKALPELLAWRDATQRLLDAVGPS